MDTNELSPGKPAALLQWWDNINHVLQIQPDEETVPPEAQELLE